MLIAFALLHAVTPIAAQSIADQIRAIDEGALRMSFAAKPGVCGDGRTFGSIRRTDDWEGFCEQGPVRVIMQIRDHEVVGVDSFVGGRWRPASNVTDLGIVAAADAAAYLLSLAASADGRVGKDAIVPAALADSATVWPLLLAIARNAARPPEIRRSAVFWLGQAAAAEAVTSLREIVDDQDGDIRVREHAVFALSQRPEDEAVPALIRIARSHPSPRIRKKAFFWLGQSEDPRAIALFEEILVR